MSPETHRETLEVAKWQKAILWLVLINLLTASMPLKALLAPLAFVVAGYFSYKLAVAVNSDVPWLFAILSPIPLLGIIPLLILNSRATATLRASGLRVGLMGVPRRQVNELSGRCARMAAAALAGGASSKAVDERTLVEFKFACPHCGQHLACDERSSGSRVQCPACTGEVLVPQPPRETLPIRKPSIPRQLPRGRTALTGAQTSGLAIVSLLLGVFGLFSCLGVLFGIPAIICGKRARSQIQGAHGILQGDGLALAGVVLGYVAIVWSLLAILVMVPALEKAKQRGQKARCHFNLQQIELAKQQWALSERKPAGDPVRQADLAPFLTSCNVTACPAGGKYDYGVIGSASTCSIAKHEFQR